MNMDRIIFAVCAIGCGIAFTLPPTLQPVVILAAKPAPRLQLACNKMDFQEYLRTCGARRRSL
jgi:hypothetical protein